jgi:hypothetical protein
MNKAACIAVALILTAGAAGGRSQSTAPSPTVPAAPAGPVEPELSPVEYRRVTQGYKKLRKNGGYLYCRDEAPLGSRLPRKYCLTLAQLIELDRNREENRRRLERIQTLRPLKGE